MQKRPFSGQNRCLGDLGEMQGGEVKGSKQLEEDQRGLQETLVWRRGGAWKSFVRKAGPLAGGVRWVEGVDQFLLCPSEGDEIG